MKKDYFLFSDEKTTEDFKDSFVFQSLNYTVVLILRRRRYKKGLLSIKNKFLNESLVQDILNTFISLKEFRKFRL